MHGQDGFLKLPMNCILSPLFLEHRFINVLLKCINLFGLPFPYELNQAFRQKTDCVTLNIILLFSFHLSSSNHCTYKQTNNLSLFE